MRNIKLIIEYDGTNYNGWQAQKDESIATIEGEIERALKLVMNEKVELLGSSRTDTGVHAMGQVGNFLTNSTIPLGRIPLALNSILPDDIVIKMAEEVDEEFHARYSSKGKKYRYTVLNDRIPSAIYRDFSYFCPYELNVEDMKEACKYFVGKHDFEAFKSAGSSVKTSVRTIFDAELVQKENILEFYISGDGFLYNMVRIIVGTLIEVGRGKISPEGIENIILSKDRKKAGNTAPAKGLCLMEVYY